MIKATVGLPACGKTTWGAQWATRGDSRVVVERDIIRLELGLPPVGSRKEEDLVTEVQDRRIRRQLRAGKTVLVADTNLRLDVLRRFAMVARGRLVIIDFTHVDLETCLSRNAQRHGGKRVPEDVIRRMATRIPPLTCLPWPVIDSRK